MRVGRAIVPPPPPFMCEERVSPLRPPGPLRVGFERRTVAALPASPHSVDEAPGKLDFIPPREKGCIPLERVEEQTLIRFRDNLVAERIPVMELHVHRACVHPLIRDLCHEPEVQPFVRLYADAEVVRKKLRDSGLHIENLCRGTPELYDDLRALL